MKVLQRRRQAAEERQAVVQLCPRPHRGGLLVQHHLEVQARDKL
jgi:hypothetical protein